MGVAGSVVLSFELTRPHVHMPGEDRPVAGLYQLGELVGAAPSRRSSSTSATTW